MPARLPAETKALRGTLRPCREKADPLAHLASIPEPPDYVSAEARVEWARLAPEVAVVGIARPDLRALAMLAETLATVSALQAAIQQDGVTLPAGDGSRKSHPSLAALAQQRTLAAKLLADFGLSPKSRVSLPPPPKPDKHRDEFEDF